jgi:hypothetical protein
MLPLDLFGGYIRLTLPLDLFGGYIRLTLPLDLFGGYIRLHTNAAFRLLLIYNIKTIY